MTRGLVALLVLASIAGCSSSKSGSAANACPEDLTSDQCDQLKAIMLPAALPAARGNDHAGDFNSSLLGFHVFFDSRFSQNENVRCESCHSVDFGFDDDQPVPVAGLGPGVRNAPTIFNAARYETFFWDGRADTLWSQPLFAFENPNEMGFTRLEIVHLLNAVYGDEYGAAFGTLPDFSDMTRFPAQGAPGNPAFDAMAPADQTLVNSVVANIGKALEAYERNVATGPSIVDEYLLSTFGGADAGGYGDAGSAAPYGGNSDAGSGTMTAQQVHGMVVFAKSGCPACHSGPQLSDNQFHNLGVPAAPGQAPDPGHSDAAIATLDNNPFNSAGPFFDGADGSAAQVVSAPAVLGGFRTPSLRNLPSSAPYGHNGTFAAIGDIVDFHLQGGGTDPNGYVGTIDPLLQPQTLSTDDRAALLEFLNALAGRYPALPWGQWPGGNG
ncbi:MAG TPA: cytochrome c peroxidase [Polyangiaceae bacterium]|jgi:cytochrome c peroxidase|nr:cytochrome c peroxidase [Polyangiaceae bacterium]